MLTRISSRSTGQVYSAAQRCLLIRHNSSQASQPTSSSSENAPAQTLQSGSEIEIHSKPSGFEPKDPYRHPKSQPIDSKLPTPALRSLFALHHASRNFITPQTLDKAIDAAFATSNHLTPYSTRVEKSLRDLDREVETRRLEDRENYPFTLGRAEQELRQQKKLRDLETYGAGMRTSDGGSMPMSFAGQALPRDSEVRAALYGVEQTGGDLTMPGLDSLEDEAAAKRAEKAARRRTKRQARIAEQQGAKAAP